MATILHGRPVADPHRHFVSAADTRSFQANLANLDPWATSLRSLPSSSASASPAPLASLAATSDIAFGWTLRMLQSDRLQRATAAELSKDIADQSALRDVPFCGTCFHGGEQGIRGNGEPATDDDDTEDDGHIWGDDDTNNYGT